MAPLLLLAASLTVAFRAGHVESRRRRPVPARRRDRRGRRACAASSLPAWAVAGRSASSLRCVVGAAWSLLPALLRAYQGVNEIITTLMMTFLGVSLANVLVKLVFRDPATTVPQTRTLPVRRPPAAAVRHDGSAAAC